MKVFCDEMLDALRVLLRPVVSNRCLNGWEREGGHVGRKVQGRAVRVYCNIIRSSQLLESWSLGLGLRTLSCCRTTRDWQRSNFVDCET